MNYSSRFWLYAPLCLFLGLAAWAGIHWWIAASAFDKKLDAMKGREAIPGVIIDWKTKTVSGFPFRLDAVFTGLSTKGAAARGPFAWTSDQFAMHALTYGRAQQIFEASGQQRLSWTDAQGVAHGLSFLPATLRASATSDARGLARFDLDIADAGGKDSQGSGFTAGRLQLHFRRDPKADDLDLAVSASEVKNAGAMLPFGTHVRSMTASLTLDHRTALAPLLLGAMSLPDADAGWRKAGGSARFEASEGFSTEQVSALRTLLSPLY